MFSFSDNTSEDFLRRIHQSNASFINSLHDGFELLELVYDKQGNIEDFIFLEVNAAYERQSGLKATDLIGKRKKSVAPAAEQRWYDYAIKAVKTCRTLSYQYHNPATNGYYDTQFIPIQPNEIAVIFKDITTHKKAEKALKLTKQNIQDIITQSPFAFAIFDKNGLLIQVNDAWVKL
jgi:PAS domain-containing protein